MTATQLSQVVAAIRELLETHGQESKAAWLEERERTLEAGGPPETIKTTIKELHSIVLGMGGLFDLPLASPSQEAGEAARVLLDELADRLFEMTRST